MASFLTDLWSSVFTPGPTPALLLATNTTFCLLLPLLLTLLFVTRSAHFAALSVLCASLWVAVNWFARELAAAQKQEEEEKRTKEEQQANAMEGTDTETEREAQTPRRSLRKRNVAEQRKEDASTDSEWEKVEGEKVET